jgi:NAD(P)-dependent dehydrogenase (short-subunit alcohol dehydrogenase family)
MSTAQTPDRVALVTGANKGLGFEIARQLGQQRVCVLLGARHSKRGRAAVEQLKAEGIDAHSVILDVTHAPSIERTRHFIEREYGRLDILVNNAGVAHDASLAPSETPLETIRDVFETNFFGVIAVTQALLPLLRLSQAGRIVNMSSSLGSLTRNADPTSPFASMRLLGYNASKTALNAFTVLLASELRATPVKVNSADPDWCKTDMGGKEAPFTAAEGAATAVWLATLDENGPTGGFFNKQQAVPW